MCHIHVGDKTFFIHIANHSLLLLAISIKPNIIKVLYFFYQKNSTTRCWKFLILTIIIQFSLNILFNFCHKLLTNIRMLKVSNKQYVIFSYFLLFNIPNLKKNYLKLYYISNKKYYIIYIYQIIIVEIII